MKLCLACGATHSASVCPACSRGPEVVGGFPSFAPELAASAEGFKPEFFKQLASLEAGNFWFRARNLLIIDAIRRYFPTAASMLEIGCGTGFVLEGISRAFPRIALSGSEIFVEGLHFARDRVPDACLLQMDARHIPFREEFDVVGAFDVVEHIDEDELVLLQMWQAVRPGGGVVITVPQHPSLWSVQDEIACHKRRYRRGEMEGKLRAAGFDVLMTTSFVSFLLPLLAVARKKKVANSHDPASELKLPRALNSLLYAVLAFERRLIKHGVRFPIGGTRLIVARKERSK